MKKTRAIRSGLMHVVTPADHPFPGKHMIQLVGGQVIWGDEWEFLS